MADTRIDSLFDLGALGPEVEAVKGLVASIKSELKTISTIKIKMDGGQSFKEVTDLQKQAATASQIIEREKAKVAREAAVAEREKAKVAREVAAAERERAKAAKDAQAVLIRDKKIVEEATNEYKQLSLALRDAEVRYKNLALTGNANTQAGREALAQALSIRRSLDTVDRSLGNFQRNVGNYSSAFKGVGMNMQQVFRELPALGMNMHMFILAISNNIPMLADSIQAAKLQIAETNKIVKESALLARQKAEADALAAGSTTKAAVAAGKMAEAQAMSNAQAAKAPTLFQLLSRSIFSWQTAMTVIITLVLLFSTQLQAMGASLMKGKKAFDDTKGSIDAFNKSLDGTLVSGARQKFTELAIDIQLAKKGFLDKENVLKKYNETLGKTIGAAKDLDEAEKLMTKNGAAYMQMVFMKAVANEFLNEAVKKAAESEKMALFGQLNIMEEIEAYRQGLSTIQKIKQIAAAVFTPGQKPMDVWMAEGAASKKGVDKKAKALDDEKQGFLLLYEKKIDEIREHAKKYGLKLDDLFGITGDDKPGKKAKESTDKAVADLIKALNTEFEIWEITQKRIIGLFKEDYENRNRTYYERLQSLEAYINAEKQLLDKQEQNEKDKLRADAAREIINLQKDKKGKSGAQVKRIDENIGIVKDNLKQAELLVEAKFQDSMNKLYYEGAKTRNQILKDELAAEEKAMNDKMEIVDKQQTDKYNREIKNLADYIKTRRSLLKDLYAAEFQLASDAMNAMFDIFQSGQDRQLMDIEERRKKDEEDAKRKEDAVSRMVLSEQEKEDRIAQIRATAEAKEREAEKRRKQIEYQKALFERQNQIFQISVDTIRAVAAIKIKLAELVAASTLNPLLASLIPFASAQIPIAIATGAASVAAVLARPLPRYKYGRGTGRDEWAIVGDGGRSEVIERREGIEFTPAKSTLAYLRSGDVVHKSINDFLVKQPNLKNMTIINDDKPDFRGFADRMVDAVGNIEVLAQVVTEGGHRYRNLKLDEYNSWVKQMTGRNYR